MIGRRLAAISALALGAASTLFAVVVAIDAFPGGLTVVLCGLIAVTAGFWGAVRRGAGRSAALAVATVGLAGAVGLALFGGHLLESALVFAGVGLALGLAARAFTATAELPAAAPPGQPVLFFNPLSGGGKAERFQLAAEARRRGIEPVELRRGDDLETLVRDAVSRGADGLAAAGGDGTQAIVAAIAAELDLPFACIPAGTRNHFALDLGVDRDDVVGALEAFVDGGERRVDLAELNGRVFVNNVSLGLYAEAVQRQEYRDAKLRTLLKTVPEALGAEGDGLDLRLPGPDGGVKQSAAAILVSNNPYRLARAIASGTRPRMDSGQLGVVVVEPPAAAAGGAPSRGSLRQWSAPSLEVDSGSAVPAGIDGEAAMIDPPLLFRSRPGALRVRIARAHPGASPSAGLPEHPGAALGTLVRIASGRAN
jgi:diacylglycerol kinase family enzyme